MYHSNGSCEERTRFTRGYAWLQSTDSKAKTLKVPRALFHNLLFELDLHGFKRTPVAKSKKVGDHLLLLDLTGRID